MSIINRKHSLILASLSLIYACNFRVVKQPGSQYSTSVVYSKEVDAFICEYLPIDSLFNGVVIESIFAERKYSSNGGFLSGFENDCCNAQLIVVSKSYLASDGRGYGVDWEIPNFTLRSGSLISCDYKGVAIPDTIRLNIKRKNDGKPIHNVVLYKKI